MAEYFRVASHEGLEERLRAALPRRGASARRERPRYVERLEFEIETILKMGFPGYFLIVADFINWAQEQRLPGRPGPRLGRRFAGGLFAEASPTSTRCATTCCSSAS